MARSLEALLDELYAAAPSEFMKARAELAKEAGSKDDAAAIARRRKPTQAAYVLNQLARQHADEVADLVDAGRTLARAQRKALRGEEDSDLRSAIERQRAVVRRLTTTAAALTRELGLAPEGHLDDVSRALQAALVDPAVGEALEAGRLEKAPEPAATFAFGELPMALPKPEVKRAPKPDAKRAPKPDAKREARAKREAEKEAKREAEREAKRKASAERAARKEAERVERERAIAEAKRAVEAHEAEAADLEARAAEASARAKELTRAAATARRAVAAAKRQLAAASSRARS